jgi:hypothetical protein
MKARGSRHATVLPKLQVLPIFLSIVFIIMSIQLNNFPFLHFFDSENL